MRRRSESWRLSTTIHVIPGLNSRSRFQDIVRHQHPLRNVALYSTTLRQCATISDNTVNQAFRPRDSFKLLYLFRTVTSATFAISAISFSVLFSDSKIHA